MKSLEIILKSVLNISDNIAQLYRGHVCLMYTVVVCFIVIIRSVSFILLVFSVIFCCYLLLLVWQNLKRFGSLWNFESDLFNNANLSSVEAPLPLPSAVRRHKKAGHCSTGTRSSKRSIGEWGRPIVIIIDIIVIRP